MYVCIVIHCKEGFPSKLSVSSIKSVVTCLVVISDILLIAQDAKLFLCDYTTIQFMITLCQKYKLHV